MCTEFMTYDSKKLRIAWDGPKHPNGATLIKRRVQKNFGGLWYNGYIKNYNSDRKLYMIEYEDQDTEEVNEKELMKILRSGI